ncbi:E3 ubiquitin-protein ligase [Schistosoma japonicum]|nr:E3 ubiquitin-protein ligase [Schistosoma japonicum]KAH8864521.1 E3 ubiquitin-protein ligase [Schistosoma japonicum]KAH8864522.1 E3 ubiquitin-protein ligase [Schistosoma japonicum]KAH8864523.1 E3 ubiquitin-protein ligase [Schistosoma japonicum]
MSNNCSACPKKVVFPETDCGICQSCGEFYCSECSSVTTDSTILCKRCKIFESNQVNWNSLMGLNVRDLKWFLRRHNIPSVGLIEKEQFVEAVLRSLGTTIESSNTRGHGSLYSTKLKVKLEDLMSEESIENLSVRQIKDLLVDNFVDFIHCVEKAELIAKAKQLWRDIKQQEASLKAVVDKNCQNVGVSHEKCPPEKSSDNLNDECGICMEAPINCVYLECGHLFSCVDCGRKLTECPLCRQSIVRIVRTFRV